LSQDINRQELAIQYLLGGLSQEEKTRFEEQYFLDDDEFEQLEVAEDELIERYVRNELSAEDTSRFKKLLVSPGLSERVELARLLVQQTAPKAQAVTTPVTVPVQPVHVGWWDRLFGPAAAIPAFRPAFAMSIALLLLTTVAFLFVWTKLRTESQRLAQQQQQQEDLRRQIEQQRARYRELESKLDKTEKEREEQAALAAEYKRLLGQEQQRSVPASIFPIVLGPWNASRGTGSDAIKPMTIPSQFTKVAISLNVTHGDYPRYNASVKNIDSDKVITTKTNLNPVPRGGRKYISMNLNADELRSGTYNVHVDGVTAAGSVNNFEDYLFRIKSR
jgi:hypothetical protein